MKYFISKFLLVIFGITDIVAGLKPLVAQEKQIILR